MQTHPVLCQDVAANPAGTHTEAHAKAEAGARGCYTEGAAGSGPGRGSAGSGSGWGEAGSARAAHGGGAANRRLGWGWSW